MKLLKNFCLWLLAVGFALLMSALVGTYPQVLCVYGGVLLGIALLVARDEDM